MLRATQRSRLARGWSCKRAMNSTPTGAPKSTDAVKVPLDKNLQSAVAKPANKPAEVPVFFYRFLTYSLGLFLFVQVLDQSPEALNGRASALTKDLVKSAKTYLFPEKEPEKESTQLKTIDNVEQAKNTGEKKREVINKSTKQEQDGHGVPASAIPTAPTTPVADSPSKVDAVPSPVKEVVRDEVPIGRMKSVLNEAKKKLIDAKNSSQDTKPIVEVAQKQQEEVEKVEAVKAEPKKVDASPDVAVAAKTSPPSTAAPSPVAPVNTAPVAFADFPLVAEVEKATDSKIMRQAISDSAREIIALRRELESTLLKDIHLLDEQQLRTRVKQLATEMFERLAWEDLRMNQSLKGTQAEITEKFTDLMERQRKTFAFELEKAIFAKSQEHELKVADIKKALQQEYETKLNETVRQQAAGHTAALEEKIRAHNESMYAEFENVLVGQVGHLQQKHQKELQANLSTIQGLQTKLSAIESISDTAAKAIRQIEELHELSAAVLSLELALSNTSNVGSKNLSIADRFEAVKASCVGDVVVQRTIETLPPRVIRNGALPLPELQARFAVMRDEVRKVALAPESAPSMVGHLIGTVLATISSAPSGLIQGPGAEETLSRAAYFLERGDLAQTLKELNTVEGYAQVLMKDWKSLVGDRIAVDETIKILKANAVLRHKSFSSRA